MPQRSFTAIALLSALAFMVLGGCTLRQWWAADNLRLVRWNPANRAYTELRASGGGGEFFLHAERAVARATDDATALRSEAGPSGSTFTHQASPSNPWDESPVVWVDHYRATPLGRVDQRVLGDCWTLEFRATPVLAVLACAPLLWIAIRLRRRTRRRGRGFGVITERPDPAV